MGRGRRVSLGARGRLGLVAGLVPRAGGEVGPLARHWESVLAEAGQDVGVHVPAAALDERALLVNGVAPDEAPHTFPEGEEDGTSTERLPERRQRLNLAQRCFTWTGRFLEDSEDWAAQTVTTKTMRRKRKSSGDDKTPGTQR